MKKILFALTIVCISLSQTSFGQANDGVKTQPDGIISIASRGRDVREVLHDLFTQNKKNYVFEQGNRVDLFLSLTDVDFAEALQIVCKTGNLSYEIQNGIYYVTRSKIQKPSVPTLASRPVGRLPITVLDRKITTKFAKTDLRKVIADIARQTNIRIEIADDVPSFTLDAFLKNTSLKYGLDLLTGAIGAEYKFTDFQSIVIKKAPDNRISLSEQAGERVATKPKG